MSSTTFTVADYLLTRLKQLDVTEVFQIPGDYVKHFTQALEHFPGITTIGTANELDAGYAADAYARTRGLAAISLQYGVSTFSALNAIAGAYVERSPIVVISACPGADARNITDMYGVTFHHSTGDLHADQNVLENVTVAAITLSTNVGAAEAIDNLIVEALTHSRPVYIACYKEVWGQPCPKPSKTPLKARVLSGPPAELANAVDQAWSMITAAKNPVIMGGVEVLRFGLSPLLKQIIDASGFLYTTTSLGKTVLDEGGPKFLGTYSDEASIPNVIDKVLNSDCVICLGTFITDDYLIFIEKQYANMVIATTEGVRAGYFKYPEVVMREFMEALLKKFKGDKSYPSKVAAPLQPAYPDPWKSNSDPKFDKQPEVITYNRFFQHSMKFLEDNNYLKEIVMPLGVSCAMYVATNAYGMKQGSFISSAAWQCVGFATGAASGAQLGSRKRSWAIAGDGDFMMVCQAVSTMAKYKINGILFVMSNQVYAIEQVYVDMTSFTTGKFDTFDILPKWDYLAMAKAYGAEGFRIETISDLKKQLPNIWKVKGKPALVEIVIPATDLPDQMKRLGSE
jgi:indolepyruvate decarboxylase